MILGPPGKFVNSAKIFIFPAIQYTMSSHTRSYLNSLKVDEFNFIEGDDEGGLVADAHQTVGGRLKKHSTTVRHSMETMGERQRQQFIFPQTLL